MPARRPQGAKRSAGPPCRRRVILERSGPLGATARSSATNGTTGLVAIAYHVSGIGRGSGIRCAIDLPIPYHCPRTLGGARRWPCPSSPAIPTGRTVKPTTTPGRIAGATLAVLVLSSASEAMAQQSLTDQIRQGLRDEAKATKQGSAFQSLSVFGATPGVSTAIFNVDHSEPGTDLTLRTLQLPLGHELAPVFAGIRPYGELTLGYSNANETDDLDLAPPQQTTIDADFETYSVLSGVGATIPVVPCLSVRPILLAGYSRIDGDANFKGPFADELKTASSGLINDMSIDTLLLGGALQAKVAWPLDESIQFTGEARFNYFYARNFNASDSVLETSDLFGVVTARSEVDGPTPLTVVGRQTRWIAFAGATYLPGDLKDALDFDYFFEVGGGIAIVDREIVDRVSGLSARASLIAGEDVIGWSAGLSLDF